MKEPDNSQKGNQLIEKKQQTESKHDYLATKNKHSLLVTISVIAAGLLLLIVGGFVLIRALLSNNPNAMNMEQRDSILNELKCNMVWIEGGEFTMGTSNKNDSDALSDEKPAHQVTVNGFYLCKYEVTQKLWQAVMGTNVGHQLEIIGSWSQHSDVGADYPMYLISWDECQEFVNRLNLLSGKNYRLPTEAEWEYAAHGGKKSHGYKYSGSNDIDIVAWYMYNSGNTGTHIVGQKKPNELGLYDMSGNVSEWCQDWYGSYSADPQKNPIGPATGSDHIIRSGCEGLPAWSCRISARQHDIPSRRDRDLGFRLASDMN